MVVTKKIKQPRKKTAVKTVKKTVAKKIVSNELTIPVFDIEGKEKTVVTMSKDIFGGKINKPLLAQSVRVYLINQRQGNASTKTRGEVTGSTRKIYKQKGTGRARHGSTKAPVFVGGGIVGGPLPKNFKARLNNKQKIKAVQSALVWKIKQNDLICVADGLINIKPKTKIAFDFLNKISLINKKILFVLPKEKKENLVLAMRNLPRVTLIDRSSLNPYSILKNDKVIFFEKDLVKLKEEFI
jgi:large subunit ribosomal protein L4